MIAGLGEQLQRSSSELFLGPVHFSLDSARPLYWHCDEELLVEPFLAPADGVPVRLHRQIRMRPWDERSPLPENVEFDNSPVWKLFRDEGGSRVFLRSSTCTADFGSPAWQAVVPNAAGCPIDVFIGPEEERSGAAGLGWRNPLCYPLDQLLLLLFLPGLNAVMVHGACVEFGDGALVFAGKSGAGKTTLSRLIHTEFPASKLITDDRVLLVKTNSGWIAGGTPWPGEGRFAMNEWRPLHSLNFLEQGVGNHFEPMTISESLSRLLPVVSVPWFDAEGMTAVLQTCEELLLASRQHRFVFEANAGAARAAATFACV